MAAVHIVPYYISPRSARNRSCRRLGSGWRTPRRVWRRPPPSAPRLTPQAGAALHTTSCRHADDPAWVQLPRSIAHWLSQANRTDQYQATCGNSAGWLVRRRSAHLALHLQPTLLPLTTSPQCEAHWRRRRAALQIPRQRHRCLRPNWRASRRRDWRCRATDTRRPPTTRCAANSECGSPGGCACLMTPALHAPS